MQMYFQGVQVPALGSLRDIIFRDFLFKEAKKEAKKQELQLLIALGNSPGNTEGARKWFEEAKKLFNDYVSLLVGLETAPMDPRERDLRNFYDNVISKSSPKLFKDKDGNAWLSDFPRF